MTITKFGHSCLLVADQATRILIDPGIFSEGQWALTNLDAILITQEHADHLAHDKLPSLIKQNPGVRIFANQQVVTLLEESDITAYVLGDRGKNTVKNILIEGIGVDHAVIHSSVPVIRNTGYLLNNIFFYPGDNFTVPNRPIEVLAFPLAAPWAKLSEVIDYLEEVKPKIGVPVHDAILSEFGRDIVYRCARQILEKNGGRLEILPLNQSVELKVSA